MIRNVLGILALFLTWTVNAAPPPARLSGFEAVYEVRAAGLLLGDAKVTLTLEGDRFVYDKQTVSRGLMSLVRKESVSETSTGTLGGDGAIRVQAYQYRQKKGGESREDSLRFASPTRISGVYKQQSYELDVPAGTLDRTAVELALMRDADKGRGEPLEYSVVERGKLKEYRFRHDGTVKVTVPAGPFECEQFSTMHDSDKRRTSFCLAPALRNLLVRASHEENGVEIDMVLISFRL